MSLLSEFREFAVKGNAFDLAVGVIIGAAFGKIVDSMVGDLIMPFVSALVGGKVDFSNMYLLLGTLPDGIANNLDAIKKAGVPVFAYGSFLTILINFILLAFVIFMLVRYLGRLKAKFVAEEAAAPPAPPPAAEVLLAEIRDELKRRPA
ncbi:MAG: large conductance mechanosensitive channel protein MscL [Burkholderiales bacterium]|nr:large conductance mechanosensitive channel protein MscL [Burkholderiales bacterium]